jgi:type I restriction enzyme S subunit
MKYCLKDICSITKGATGIMKADGGKYPLVALSDERRSHNEFQFDANAVIVPLISSTGHGHASMKRVHYQEGKFALGNILCAVIPKDETKLNAKYLHLYLQQFKETLLVPLMKGAANVSLPMNKLADVEIEVPSLERQLEIIALEDKAAELKNELEEKLILQDGDITKLRQALLKEAMQGKLTKQNPKDGNAKDLLEKIITEKTKLGIKEKPIAEIKEVEIPFDIPESWVWCRLGKIVLSMTNGIYKEEKFYNDSGVGCFRMYNIKDGKITFEKIKRMILTAPECSSYNLEENDLLLNRVNSIELLGKSALIKGLDEPFVFER